MASGTSLLAAGCSICLTGFVVCFPWEPGAGGQGVAGHTGGKKNRSEVMKSLLISQDTWGDLTMSTNPSNLLPQKTKLNTTPLPVSLNDPLGKK